MKYHGNWINECRECSRLSGWRYVRHKIDVHDSEEEVKWLAEVLIDGFGSKRLGVLVLKEALEDPEFEKYRAQAIGWILAHS